MRKLFDHQRWLTSQGQAGRKLEEEGIDLSYLQLDGIDLSGAEIPHARFVGSSLRFARLSTADLTDATLMFCDLESASFRGAKLKDALLVHSAYGAADFTEADTTGVCWTDDDFRPSPTNDP